MSQWMHPQRGIGCNGMHLPFFPCWVWCFFILCLLSWCSSRWDIMWIPFRSGRQCAHTPGGVTLQTWPVCMANSHPSLVGERDCLEKSKMESLFCLPAASPLSLRTGVLPLWSVTHFIYVVLFPECTVVTDAVIYRRDCESANLQLYLCAFFLNILSVSKRLHLFTVYSLIAFVPHAHV